MTKKLFTTTGNIWKYPAETGAWYFLTLSKSDQENVRKHRGVQRGWGQVRVEVTIGSSTWKTSVFPDKTKGFVLPVKASVRKKEGLDDGIRVRATLKLL